MVFSARFFLIFAICGLVALYSSLIFNVIIFSSLNRVADKSKVLISGKVEKQILAEDHLSFYIDNVSVRCNCIGNYSDKTVEVLGYVDSYNDRRFVNALKITEIIG